MKKYAKFGELRMGADIEKMKGVIWRHWTCCSDQVFENMRKTISGPEELNGWNELREDDQERVRRGWNEGSIPDNERPDPAYPKEAK
ncbi:hypothetical protein G6F56_011449 [Rhizopus delemar]|nr:hypothetical protein G6F56_011449 [Rhizopus delemar]